MGMAHPPPMKAPVPMSLLDLALLLTTGSALVVVARSIYTRARLHLVTRRWISYMQDSIPGEPHA